MKLNPIGSNQTEIEKADGVTVLYSYSTPVAAFHPKTQVVLYSDCLSPDSDDKTVVDYLREIVAKAEGNA